MHDVDRGIWTGGGVLSDPRCRSRNAASGKKKEGGHRRRVFWRVVGLTTYKVLWGAYPSRGIRAAFLVLGAGIVLAVVLPTNVAERQPHNQPQQRRQQDPMQPHLQFLKNFQRISLK